MKNQLAAADVALLRLYAQKADEAFSKWQQTCVALERLKETSGVNTLDREAREYKQSERSAFLEMKRIIERAAM